MNEYLKSRSPRQKRRYAKQVREWLIESGLEEEVDAIFATAGPGFAIQSINWLDQAIHDIKDCSSERSDIMDSLYIIIGGLCDDEHEFDYKRASRILKVFGIKPPEADCESAFFRIIAGAKAAIYISP